MNSWPAPKNPVSTVKMNVLSSFSSISSFLVVTLRAELNTLTSKSSRYISKPGEDMASTNFRPVPLIDGFLQSIVYAF